jgi:hypothetical protein
MTERGEAVKTACVEVREELNRKLAGVLGMDEARRLEENLDAAAGLFGKIARDATIKLRATFGKIIGTH